MNVEGGSFARCVRHPSQFFTGFCSSCLAERLSNVDSIDRSPEASSRPRGDTLEISAVLGSEGKGSEIRVRTTLLALFQLDDCESKTSTSGSARVDYQVESIGDRDCKDKDFPSSGLPVKRLRWRLGGSSSKSGRFADKQLESKRDVGHSCDWRTRCELLDSSDAGKGTWEKPRHSWDGGSVMSKALACSFACLEEPHGGSSRVKRRLPEEAVVTDPDRCTETVSASGGSSMAVVDEKPPSLNDSLGTYLRERHHEECHQEVNVARKKSHRWSRVWDWSITSPFRDFAKKREHILERSLSGTWPEAQKDKDQSHIGMHPYANNTHGPQTNQSLNRNMNGEVQRFRPDWQRKRDYRFGRSRSVNYPPPGGMDNGLLRFYLTPMRTSRRTSNSGRMRNSRLFTKGIFGH